MTMSATMAEDDTAAEGGPPVRSGMAAAVGVSAVLLSACVGGPPPVVTPIPQPAALGSTLRPTQTTAGERPLPVAVAVGTPTATPLLSGDYATLVRPRLEHVQQTLAQLDQHIAILRTAPVRLAESDWRAEAQARVEAIGGANTDLRALGARTGADAALSAEVLKLVGELDFVVDEYHQAFDFDPDGTHFTRAGRAERSTADDVDSLLTQLRRRSGTAPTRSGHPRSRDHARHAEIFLTTPASTNCIVPDRAGPRTGGSRPGSTQRDSRLLLIGAGAALVLTVGLVIWALSSRATSGAHWCDGERHGPREQQHAVALPDFG